MQHQNVGWSYTVTVENVKININYEFALMCFLWISEQSAIVFLFTVLTGRFLYPKRRVFTGRYKINF